MVIVVGLGKRAIRKMNQLKVEEESLWHLNLNSLRKVNGCDSNTYLKDFSNFHHFFFGAKTFMMSSFSYTLTTPFPCEASSCFVSAIFAKPVANSKH